MKSIQVQLATSIDYVHAHFERFMREKMKGQGLEITKVRFGILYQIQETGAINQKELAHWNNISPQALHRHIKLLEQKGCIIKKNNKNDARSYTLELTKKGDKIITDSKKILTTSVKDFYANLNAKEIHTLITLLAKVQDYKKTN